MLRYNMMTKSLCCVLLEVRCFPYYDGLTDIDKILDALEMKVPEKHHFQTLDLALRLQDGRVRIKTILMDGAST